jgi:hypothetical protein
MADLRVFSTEEAKHLPEGWEMCSPADVRDHIQAVAITSDLVELMQSVCASVPEKNIKAILAELQ